MDRRVPTDWNRSKAGFRAAALVGPIDCLSLRFGLRSNASTRAADAAPSESRLSAGLLHYPTCIAGRRVTLTSCSLPCPREKSRP